VIATRTVPAVVSLPAAAGTPVVLCGVPGMRLRILKTWRRLKPDTEVNIADGAANVLVKRGFAEPVQTVKRKRGSRRASNATQND